MDEEERASLSEFLHGTAPEDPAAADAQPDNEDPPEEPGPTEQDDGDEPPLLPSASQEASVIRGIAEFALDRAREMAGAKVRSARRSCPECFEGFEGVTNRDLVAAMGRERLERIGAPKPGALVAGISNAFLTTCERMGIRISSELAEGIELHAATWLFEANPPPLPEDLLLDLVRV